MLLVSERERRREKKNLLSHSETAENVRKEKLVIL